MIGIVFEEIGADGMGSRRLALTENSDSNLGREEAVMGVHMLKSGF